MAFFKVGWGDLSLIDEVILSGMVDVAVFGACFSVLMESVLWRRVACSG